ncbi:hypothetical protein M569_06770 [Genlisea aurea]|uniref:Uncharacterized protein n=1 Tax=Genlisea aurea TaxID=192259 RepID=S8CLG8_9LAMI|nr:hypothetical protein M569_06770 [Genlisea aurea]
MTISIIARERILGATLGAALATVVVFEQRGRIYESINETQFQRKEPIFGRKSRQELAHLWNISVDKALRPLIQSLSSRGW